MNKIICVESLYFEGQGWGLVKKMTQKSLTRIGQGQNLSFQVKQKCWYTTTVINKKLIIYGLMNNFDHELCSRSCARLW